MPRYRQLHTKIVDSEDFSAMPDDFCRMFWMLLTVIVDSEGRGIDNPAWVRSKMFPIREDVKTSQITGAMDWLEGRGMLIRYQVKGRGYFYLPTFKQYQSGLDREAKSVLPAPDQLLTNSGERAEEVLHSASASAFESASVVVDDIELDEFTQTRNFIEKKTGITGDGPNAIKAIDEILSMKAMQEDIANGINWLVGEGRRIRSYSQLVGPTRTAMQKRIQSNGNGRHSAPPKYTETF